MKASQRLDTPFKRISLLALIVGGIMLAVSLVVWTQESRRNKIFYSQYFGAPYNYNKGVDEWPSDHPILFTLGLFLAVGGLLGSYGYRASSLVIQCTAGRILTWVKTGDFNTVKAAPSANEKMPLANPEGALPASAGNGAAQDRQAQMEKPGSNRFVPHIAIFGFFSVVLGLGIATNDPTIGSFFGRIAGSAEDPFNLILATVLGLTIRHHLILITSLAVVGVALAIVIAEMNASLGASLTPEGISAKIAAALIVGYIANLIPTIFQKKDGEKRNNA